MVGGLQDPDLPGGNTTAARGGVPVLWWFTPAPEQSMSAQGAGQSTFVFQGRVYDGAVRLSLSSAICKEEDAACGLRATVPLCPDWQHPLAPCMWMLASVWAPWRGMIVLLPGVPGGPKRVGQQARAGLRRVCRRVRAAARHLVPGVAQAQAQGACCLGALGVHLCTPSACLT